MKNIARLLGLLMIVSFSSREMGAQCIPDTINCIDINAPGEICPSALPDATVNEPYDETITIIAPDTVEYGELVIALLYIVLDSVEQLPPGIDYITSADTLYPDSAYCVQVFGTPTEAGEFPIAIYVNPFIDIGTGPISVGQIADDTSVVMTVLGTSGIDPYPVHEFRVLPNIPNPFSEITRLGFYTPFDDRIELKVYNILGELMHEELLGVPPGEHYFRFNGRELIPGTYFYRVTNSSSFLTGKFIKSR